MKKKISVIVMLLLFQGCSGRKKGEKPEFVNSTILDHKVENVEPKLGETEKSLGRRYCYDVNEDSLCENKYGKKCDVYGIPLKNRRSGNTAFKHTACIYVTDEVVRETVDKFLFSHYKLVENLKSLSEYADVKPDSVLYAGEPEDNEGWYIFFAQWVFENDGIAFAQVLCPGVLVGGKLQDTTPLRDCKVSKFFTSRLRDEIKGTDEVPSVDKQF